MMEIRWTIGIEIAVRVVDHHDQIGASMPIVRVTSAVVPVISLAPAPSGTRTRTLLPVTTPVRAKRVRGTMHASVTTVASRGMRKRRVLGPRNPR